MSADPLEIRNLAHPRQATPQSRVIQSVLAALLVEQCRQKRLLPSSGQVLLLDKVNHVRELISERELV